MKRIARGFVERQLDNLNRLAGMPMKPYATALNPDSGDMYSVPQAGCFFLENQYGQFGFRRMSLTPGCTGESAMVHGYYDLRAISNQIYAFTQGYRAAMEAQSAKVSA